MSNYRSFKYHLNNAEWTKFVMEFCKKDGVYPRYRNAFLSWLINNRIDYVDRVVLMLELDKFARTIKEPIADRYKVSHR